MPVTPWASDATYSPPAAAGADQSTKINPSAGERAQGFIPGTHFPIQWLNFVLNELGVLGNANESDAATNAANIATNSADIATNSADITALEGSRVMGPGSASDNAIARFDGTTGKLVQDSGLGVNDSDELVYATPKSRITEVGPWASVNDGWQAFKHLAGTVPSVEATGTSKILFVPVSLPAGAVITKVQAMVKPATARATVSDRVQMQVERTALDWVSPGISGPNNIGSLQSDDGTTAIQILDTGTISHTLDGVDRVLVRIRSGATAGADVVLGIRVHWDDPGPTNHMG